MAFVERPRQCGRIVPNAEIERERTESRPDAGEAVDLGGRAVRERDVVLDEIERKLEPLAASCREMATRVGGWKNRRRRSAHRTG